MLKITVKKTEKVPNPVKNADGTLTQFVNITPQIEGYETIDLQTKTASFVFSENTSFKEIDAKIEVFANEWVTENIK